MPGNGNGGSQQQSSGGSVGGHWSSTGEGGREWVGGTGQGIDLSNIGPAAPTEPPPRVPVLRAAKNVQKANIDRTSLYDPTSATQALGADYLQQRNASNPQPQGSTGAGAVGYEFLPSTERLY